MYYNRYYNPIISNVKINVLSTKMIVLNTHRLYEGTLHFQLLILLMNTMNISNEIKREQRMRIMNCV